MVSPGAVYFFEKADGAPFAESDARSLWLAAVGSRTHEGFGRVVPGVWSPARSTS
jgi:CRISPR-associated protein Cmr3